MEYMRDVRLLAAVAAAVAAVVAAVAAAVAAVVAGASVGFMWVPGCSLVSWFCAGNCCKSKLTVRNT